MGSTELGNEEDIIEEEKKKNPVLSPTLIKEHQRILKLKERLRKLEDDIYFLHEELIGRIRIFNAKVLKLSKLPPIPFGIDPETQEVLPIETEFSHSKTTASIDMENYPDLQVMRDSIYTAIKDALSEFKVQSIK